MADRWRNRSSFGARVEVWYSLPGECPTTPLVAKGKHCKHLMPGERARAGEVKGGRSERVNAPSKAPKSPNRAFH